MMVRATCVFLCLCLLAFSLGCGPKVRQYKDEEPASVTSVEKPISSSRPTKSTNTDSSVQHANAKTKVKAIIFKTKSGKEAPRLTVEVVDTPEGIRRGLMYRKSMDKNHGMLFMMPQPRYQSFWMKNTHLPLSIAFIGDDMRIINICKMKPLDTGPRYRSKKKCRYALEVNQGWFEENGIQAGDRVIFLSETK